VGGRAFSLVGLAVVILVLVVLFAVVSVTTNRIGCGVRQLSDATQMRAIAQALVFSPSTTTRRDGMLRPSEVDSDNRTLAAVPGDEFKKDTTGNLLSLLIWDGTIAPELCYSPAEASAHIRIDDGYESTVPSGAADPAHALWDPKFAGTPDQTDAPGTAAARTPGIGTNSYAINTSLGDRGARWVGASSRDALVCNRGPGYMGTTAPVDGWRLNPSGVNPPGVGSVTLLIHGSRSTWEGNVAYYDLHTSLESRPDPIELTYVRQGTAASVPDNLFVNETDDATRRAGVKGNLDGMNQYLLMISRVVGTRDDPGVVLFKD
jgi:hypothetical protein